MSLLNITINDINMGLKSYMRYSQQNSTGKEFEHMSFNERMSVVSHYLHNQGTDFAIPFKDMALKIMNDIYEWKIKYNAI